MTRSGGRHQPVRWLLMLWLCCLALGPLRAETVELSAIENRLDLDRQLFLFLDVSGQLDLTAVRDRAYGFEQNNHHPPNFGYTSASAWIRFEARNASDRDGVWWLQIDYAMLHTADLHLIRGDGSVESLRAGLDQTTAQLDHLSRVPVFPLTVRAGETVKVFLKVARPEGNVRAPLTLRTPADFSRYQMMSQYLLGGYLGLMMAMFAYNVFLFLRMRLSFQFYYLLTVLSISGSMSLMSGFGRLLLPEASLALMDDLLIGLPALVMVFGIQFGRRFLDVRAISPLIDTLLNMASLTGAALAIGQFVTDSHLGKAVVTCTGIISPLLLMAAAYCLLRGSRSALFFLIAWTAALTGSALYSLMMHDLIPVNFMSEYGVLIGTALEIILLSLGIADYFSHQRQIHTRTLEEQNATLLKLKDAEQQLMHRAMHSGTTGLPNRTLLRETMRTIIEQKNLDPRFSLLLVNFRNFHEFNKTLGHQNGDEILRMLATRLSEHVRLNPYAISLEPGPKGSHCVATVEGVTFGCLLRNTSASEAREFAEELVRRMEQPFSFQDMSLNLQTSIGIAHFPFHGDTAEQLLRNAHIALELAGEDVQQVWTYDTDTDPYSARRLTLLGDLRQAIANDDLDLHFQPQLHLASHRITGAEVLLRWKHARHGYIPPDQFIPLAERTGIIQPLTQWVFRRAFSYLADLNQRGHTLTLSINISPRNLQDPSFQERAMQLAREYHIMPSQVVVELTETAVLLNEERGNNTLYALDNAGFGIAIDDFGTGFSSLSHLKRIPVREIKIDRGFIRDMTQRVDDQVIVSTTLQMGHNLGLRVVAEGVEDENSLDFLRKAGCDLAQGYHIARPMPYTAFVSWLEERATQDSSQPPDAPAKTGAQG
jgi:diguanylate cyclase (GGDEF)-like protein